MVRLKIGHRRLYNTPEVLDAIDYYYEHRPDTSVEDLEPLMLNKYEAQEYGLDSKDLLPFGGSTMVIAMTENGRVIGQGTSICGLKDRFCKKIGVSVALGRLDKMLNG